jgi:hypothetical protein
MSLRIRRGTDTQRQTALLDQGELAYTTDTQKLFVGDGATAGGINILASAAGTGLVFDQLTQTLKVAGSNTIVEADTAPSLGGNLNLNGYNIQGRGNVIINGTLESTIFSNTVLISASNLVLKARGTSVSPLDVLQNDQLGKSEVQGYSSGTYKISSLITSNVSARYPVTSTAVPGRLDFIVSDDQGVLSKVMDLDADGTVRMYQNAPNLSGLGVYSFLSTPGGIGTFTTFARHAGTTSAPLAVANGDRIHTLRFGAWDGSAVTSGAIISSNVIAPVTLGSVQADLKIGCRNSSGVYKTTQTNTATSITFGVMPVLPTFAGTAAATAAVGVLVNGMMYYDSVTHKITSYLNGAWVALA